MRRIAWCSPPYLFRGHELAATPRLDWRDHSAARVDFACTIRDRVATPVTRSSIRTNPSLDSMPSSADYLLGPRYTSLAEDERVGIVRVPEAKLTVNAAILQVLLRKAPIARAITRSSPIAVMQRRGPQKAEHRDEFTT